MLRLITPLLLVFLLPSLILAQKALVIRGTIYDTTAKKALPYATISLINAQDSMLVSYTKADSSGKFLLKRVTPGRYLISTSYVGYAPLWKEVVIKNEDLDMGYVVMRDIAS